MKWRKYKNYDGYIFNENGICKSLARPEWNGVGWRISKERLLKASVSHRGYGTFVICQNGKHIGIQSHRVVAELFIPNPLNLPEVNHKDRNKLNNNSWNLEWCTHYDNMKHARDTGFYKTIK